MQHAPFMCYSRTLAQATPQSPVGQHVETTAAYRARMTAQRTTAIPLMMRKAGPTARLAVTAPRTLVCATNPNTPDATSARPSVTRRTRPSAGATDLLSVHRVTSLNAHMECGLSTGQGFVARGLRG